MTDGRDLHALGCLVHGLLLALHSVGVAYNLRRRHPWGVVVHTVAAVYSVRSVCRHVRSCQEAEP